ncbi:hypothetical protein Fmac_024545 [Flemingia macrophylla]|uniref:Uncharacterized protein n=1 Tax=Flemingia macrophylla TaxID=520843 RepID=A0ABD1LPP5_9FABA
MRTFFPMSAGQYHVHTQFCWLLSGTLPTVSASLLWLSPPSTTSGMACFVGTVNGYDYYLFLCLAWPSCVEASDTDSPLSASPLATSSSSDYLFKLLLIGDSGVGKWCLLLRFSVSYLLFTFP